MKYIATAKITDPVAVQAKCAANGWQAHGGAIFCHIPELGYEGSNFIYCRYGLAIPYLRAEVGSRVLVEPTIGESERWFYTGFVDANDLSPTTLDIMKFIFNLTGNVSFEVGSNQKLKFSSTGLIIQNSATSKIEVTGTSIKLTFGPNTIELDNTSVKINGTNHEVLP